VVCVSLVAFIVLLLLYPSGEDKVVIPDTPMMHTQDWQHIDAVMEELKPELFLEWGTGSSTFYFSKHDGKNGSPVKYTSIEHHPGWCGEMKKRLWQHGLSNVDYICEPVVKGFRSWMGGWSEGGYSQFKEYIHQADNVVAKYRAEHQCTSCGAFDMLLVDGRARVGCALYVLRHLKKGSILFMHDFGRKPYTTELEKYYDLMWESPAREGGAAGKDLGQWMVKPEYAGKKLSEQELDEATVRYAAMDLDTGVVVQ